MLQNIRDKTSGWIATFILGTIIIIFGLGFGIQDYLSPQANNYVAKIEGEGLFLGFRKPTKEIGVDEFRTRFEQVRQRDMAEKGEAFDAAKFDTVESKRAVLEKLIDEKLIVFAAQQKGLKVSDAVLADAVKKLPDFQNDKGIFDILKYKSFLAGRGMSETQADELIREGIERQMVPGTIVGSSMASDAEVESYIKLERQTRDLRYLPIPAPKAVLPAPTAVEINAWYKKNSSRYRNEEKITIEYVEINGANLPVKGTASETDLRDLYDKQINAYRTADQKMASNIFFTVAKDAPASAANTALAKANNVAKLARAPGADFAALAKQYSEDEGSKDSGGDLGAIEPGLFDPAVEKAFAGLQVGQVSDPVRSADGYNVILYRENVAGEARSFEEVRTELEASYFERERERVLNKTVEQLTDAAYKDPAALVIEAKKLGLSPLRAGPFTRGLGDGIAALEPIRKAAFSDAQKTNREVSDAIEIAENQIVILRVVDYKPAGIIPLAEIRDRVQADFVAERSTNTAKSRAEALQARANKGETLDVLAKELGIPVSDWPMMPRNPPIPQLTEVAKVAFTLPRPDGKKIQIGVAKLQAESYALIQVMAVKEGDITSIDAETRKSIRKQLAQARGSVEAEAYVKSLRKEYKVTVIEGNL
ncbi:MAG: SurA N-terminal domain-containing protein [Arenimonas sp.]